MRSPRRAWCTTTSAAGAFPRIGTEMMEAVDKADSAGFTAADVLDPKGWELLSFLMDARTGLGRFRDFRVSNYQLMMTADRLLPRREHRAHPRIAGREGTRRPVLRAARTSRAQIRRVAEVRDNLVVLDLRDEPTIFAGNRFVVYAMYPQCDISLHVMWGREQANTVYTVGKSIFDRRSPVDVGLLMLAPRRRRPSRRRNVPGRQRRRGVDEGDADRADPGAVARRTGCSLTDKLPGRVRRRDRPRRRARRSS